MLKGAIILVLVILCRDYIKEFVLFLAAMGQSALTGESLDSDVDFTLDLSSHHLLMSDVMGRENYNIWMKQRETEQQHRLVSTQQDLHANEIFLRLRQKRLDEIERIMQRTLRPAT